MTSAPALTLTGVVAFCPDCGDEQILVEVDEADHHSYCCTSCDAAVLLTQQAS